MSPHRPSRRDLTPAETKFYTFGSARDPFRLHSGGTLDSVTLAYETHGELNADKSNVILVFHALSGSHHARGFTPAVEGVGERWTDECQVGWWDDFIGPGRALNTDRFCVICVNYLGGCYGSTGPSSVNPRTGRPYGSDFPVTLIRDIVDSQVRLLDHLGIGKLHAVIGSSLGGLMCMSFATRYPERVDTVIPVSTGLRTTALQQIHNLEQALAIELDPCFKGGDYYGGPAPERGLALARIVAHKTYVSLEVMRDRAHQEKVLQTDRLTQYSLVAPIESYMVHHGGKFVKRFDANTYLRLIQAWQQFDLAREAGAENLREVFERCRHQKYMVFSIDSDVSFYPDEQREIVGHLKRAGIRFRYVIVHSDKGHDSFLLEPDLFAPHFIYSLEHPWSESR